MKYEEKFKKKLTFGVNFTANRIRNKTTSKKGKNSSCSYMYVTTSLSVSFV